MYNMSCITKPKQWHNDDPRCHQWWLLLVPSGNCYRPGPPGHQQLWHRSTPACSCHNTVSRSHTPFTSTSGTGHCGSLVNGPPALALSISWPHTSGSQCIALYISADNILAGNIPCKSPPIWWPLSQPDPGRVILWSLDTLVVTDYWRV